MIRSLLSKIPWSTTLQKTIPPLRLLLISLILCLSVSGSGQCADADHIYRFEANGILKEKFIVIQ